MLLLRSAKDQVAVVIIGRGLIGSAIERAIRRKSSWESKLYCFPWGEELRSQRTGQLQTVLGDLRNSAPDGQTVHVVWAAGQAGFGASPKQTQPELEACRQVVDFVESIHVETHIQAHLHLLSSAGGLFEGIRGIDKKTMPNPARAYGKLKSAQETHARQIATASCSIYRPTSVYSTVQPGKRRGLIPTLVWNSLRNQTSTIFGKHDTLRDYIWADDIGTFIANQILGSACSGCQEFLLATAVPTPISHIVRLIEDTLMQPVPVRFIPPRENNTLDITVCSRSIPSRLPGTSLKTGIRQIYLRLMSDGLV